jgi:hypothetical protein
MTPRSNAVAAVLVACAVLDAFPAAAVDGEILIDQAKVNSGGVTPGDTAGFPATLSRPGRYKLSGNLAVPPNINGINITANDVSIDLNGFTILSATAGSGIGISAPTESNRIRIANGSITGFSYGFLNLGIGDIVEDMRIVGNSTGIRIETGRIRNSTITNNSAHGILCHGCLIEQNIIAGNGSVGIYDDTAGGGLVLGNIIAGNGNYGLISPDPPLPKTGYGNNILIGNNGSALQGLGIAQLHPNVCEPACP